jgi:transcriptional regulator with XRE-family HTH domain
MMADGTNDETNAERLRKMGERLAEERENLRLTQAGVADKLGLTREMWGRYERGMTEISRPAMKDFCKLGADEEYIRYGRQKLSAQPSATRESLRQAIEVINGAYELLAVELTDEETELLAGFRHAAPDRKRLLLELVRATKNVA